MKTIVKEKRYLFDLAKPQANAIQRALTIANPKFAEAQKMGRATWGIPRTIELFEWRGDTLILTRGVDLATLGVMPDEIIDQRHSHPVSIKTTIHMRPYQERGVRLMLANGGGVLTCPTGGGKTVCAIELAARLGQRCLILVKSKDLAEQWRTAIKKFTGLDCGLIGGGKWREGDEFTVALVQTLVKHEASLDYGLVIVDECHNTPAQQAYQVINRQAAKYRFGLSATPQRRDNLEPMIFAALGPVVAEIEPHEVEGAVLPVCVSTMQYQLQGDPHSWVEFLQTLARDPERNRQIVAAAIKSSRRIGTAVLTGTIEHAETVAAMIQAHGENALLLHGQLPKKVRDERMGAAHENNLIVGTLSLLSEGIDWPHVGAVIFASPVSAVVDKPDPAATRLIQAIGRARRPFPGKSRAFVLDIVDHHPFGLSAFGKRSAIYRQHGFAVQAIGGFG